MKRSDMFKKMINLKSIFYEDKEMQSIMKEFYLIEKGQIKKSEWFDYVEIDVLCVFSVMQDIVKQWKKSLDFE